MNERIKQLILDAGFPKFDKMYVVSDGEELEKFAELIIRECIERVRLQYIPTRDKPNRTEREQGRVECGVASVIALEELVQESTDRWYKENILED